MLFSGLRIIDLTKVYSGPLATRMFADYGAEVLKIENHQNFDDSREFAPLIESWSGYFEMLNHNKIGLALNLKNANDLQKFYQLSQSADVIVENLTPKTKHNLKIDYEIIKTYNPRIIYASLSGLGQTSNRKYYDIIAQAESGLMSLSGDSDHPLKIGPSVVDSYSGMTLAFAISSALYYRERTNQGQYLDVSMLGCSMNLLEQNLTAYSISGQNPPPPGNLDTALAPFGVYNVGDGSLALAVGNNRLWQALFQFLNKHSPMDPDLFATNDLRLKNNQLLTQIIEKVFAKFPTSELISILSELEIPCAPVLQISDVQKHDLLYQTHALRRVHSPHLGQITVPGTGINFSECPLAPYTPAPEIGQHNSQYEI